MAADPSSDWVGSLPWAWGYGITEGGRVFFINEEAKSTTWLHPVTGETVLTGHRRTPDLPTGWEEAYTFEGARYYINHNERKVTCKHPVSGRPSQDNCIFVVNDQHSSAMTSQETKERTASDSSTCNTVTNPASPLSRPSRSSRKLHNFGKRSNSIKRNPNAPVMMRGWLYKKANSGMKLWKKRWFVLCDLCLFYYRDEKEEGVLGSILLPSFQISPVVPDDHINRAFAFKAAHSNMRTYFFCCDTNKEMELWMRAMTGATLVHSEPVRRTDITKLDHPTPQEINHMVNHRLLIRPETNNNLKNKEMTLRRGEEGEAARYGFQKDGPERPLTKISTVRPQSCISDYDRAVHVNGPDSRVHDGPVHPSETDSRTLHRNFVSAQDETDRVIQRTNSMLQLEQWIRTQREKSPEEEAGGVLSYQTLPRNMPSYRAQMVPRYPEGYKTLPRNLKSRPDSVCSTTGMLYDRHTLVSAAGEEEKRRSVRDDTMWQLYDRSSGEEKRHSGRDDTMWQLYDRSSGEEPRRSVRDDTMWQLYEWQQRQFYNKQSTLRRHSSLTSPRTLHSIPHTSDHTLHSIPMSPSHGSISGYHTYSPHRAYRSEVSSPVQRGDLTIERRTKPHPTKLGFASERRSVSSGLSVPHITPQGLQGKTMNQDDCRTTAYKPRPEEPDMDAKLSRLCEQDKAVQSLEQKLQQLHKEKYTLEQALLSASQEIEMNAENPGAVQSVVLQRDDLQSGLLSTCREVSRATAELERSWREYDKLERDVTTARNQMREQLERLGEVQTESAGIQRAQMQKEIWRIQDVMEGLSKHKQRRPDTGISDPKLLSSGMSAGEGPDYRLYKSEPELTTVAEVDESNGEDKTDLTLDMEANKGSHFPVGIVPPRTKSPPLESSTIASYVTLRKSKRTDAKSERPRSAVEHLFLTEGPRPRMTLEEQLERMRRHQAACLREKKKGLNFLGSLEPPPSRSPPRENSLQQLHRKEEKSVSDVTDAESPAKDTAKLRGPTGGAGSPASSDKSGDVVRTETSPVHEAKEERAQEEDVMSETPPNCLQVSASVPKHKSESAEDGGEEELRGGGAEERSGILFSYDFSADTLRRQMAVDAGNLPPHPEAMAAPPPAQLTEGSHFMCV